MKEKSVYLNKFGSYVWQEPVYLLTWARWRKATTPIEHSIMKISVNMIRNCKVIHNTMSQNYREEYVGNRIHSGPRGWVLRQYNNLSITAICFKPKRNLCSHFIIKKTRYADCPLKKMYSQLWSLPRWFYISPVPPHLNEGSLSVITTYLLPTCWRINCPQLNAKGQKRGTWNIITHFCGIYWSKVGTHKRTYPWDRAEIL